MLRVIVDQKHNLSNLGQIQTMGELVEFIKASIDPEKIIIDIKLDGRSLTDEDWRRSLASLPQSQIEVSTGERVQYVLERIEQSPHYLERIISEFSGARGYFQGGDSTKGNQEFKTAVQDLNAYMSWYVTLLAMEEKVDRRYLDQVTEHIENITKTCERIINFMLYNSWWAVGEALQKDLEPQLSSLFKDAETFCVSARKHQNLSFPYVP